MEFYPKQKQRLCKYLSIRESFVEMPRSWSCIDEVSFKTTHEKNIDLEKDLPK